MKEYGKVINYDGFSGNVVNEKKEVCMFLNKDIMDKNNGVKNGDLVIYQKEEISGVEIPNIKVARFLRKKVR